jgi:hypothetical protein
VGVWGVGMGVGGGMGGVWIYIILKKNNINIYSVFMRQKSKSQISQLFNFILYFSLK